MIEIVEANFNTLDNGGQNNPVVFDGVRKRRRRVDAESVKDFMDKLEKSKKTVFVYLLNKTKLVGSIASQDDHCILLKDKNEMLIFKHAISTITYASNNHVFGQGA